MKLPNRLVALKERAEQLLKGFEWTWTKAVAFCVGLAFFTIITMAVLPSFWLYFADSKLHWNGSGPNGFWLKELRDAVAMGLSTGPFVTILVMAAIMQNWRRRLRGQAAERPTGGYR